MTIMKLSLAPLMIQVLIRTLFVISHAISCNFLWGSEMQKAVLIESSLMYSYQVGLDDPKIMFILGILCPLQVVSASALKLLGIKSAFLKEVPKNMQCVLS